MPLGGRPFSIGHRDFDFAAGVHAIDVHRQRLVHAAGLADADAGIADIGIAHAAAIHRPVAVVGMAFRQIAAELRIGEPDAAVLVRRQVVGRIERLAVVIVGEDGHRAIGFPAHHAAEEILGGKLAALEIEAVAVGGEGRPAEDGDLAGLPDIAIERVVLDVAEDGVLAQARPGRAFRQMQAGVRRGGSLPGRSADHRSERSTG